MRCAQCNEDNAWTLARCRSCGAALAASAGPGARPEDPPAPYRAPGPPGAYGPPASYGASGAPGSYGPPASYGPLGSSGIPLAREAATAGAAAFAFDARRWTLADKLTGGATLVLLVSLFLPWFGAGDNFISVSVGGMWHSYMIIDLILAMAILGYLVLRAGFGSLPARLSATATEYLLAGAAGVNVLLAAVSFLTKPAGTAWQYGAYLGLAAAMLAATVALRSAVTARHA